MSILPSLSLNKSCEGRQTIVQISIKSIAYLCLVARNAYRQLHVVKISLGMLYSVCITLHLKQVERAGLQLGAFLDVHAVVFGSSYNSPQNANPWRPEQDGLVPQNLGNIVELIVAVAVLGGHVHMLPWYAIKDMVGAVGRGDWSSIG